MIKFYFVYLTTNLINGKQYIGEHSTIDINSARTKRYLGSGNLIRIKIKHYGRKNFKKEILEYFNTKQEAEEAQTKFIQRYNTLVPNGYNISPTGGTRFNGRHSDETKIKFKKPKTDKTKEKMRKPHDMSEENRNKLRMLMSENNKNKNNLFNLKKVGNPLTEEHKLNISKGGKGKKHSLFCKETKLKMSAAAKNRLSDSKETKYKKGNARRGKPHTIETIQRMKNTKHNISDEGRLKLSLVNKGKKLSEETKEKIKNTLKNKKLCV